MDLETAQKELAIRLYRWGQMDFRREQRDGYPLLSPMRDESVQKFRAYESMVSTEEFTQTVMARQKFNHPAAVTLLGETFSEVDKGFHERFVMAMSQIHLTDFSWGEATKIFAVKRSLVAKTLLPLLTAAFGLKPKKFDSLQWYYLEQFGDWCFSTELDLGGTWGTEIRYQFRLKRADDKVHGLTFCMIDGKSIPIVQIPTLHALYGLGGDPSYAITDETQVLLAAQSLTDVHAHLVSVVPDWLAGLSIE